MRKIKAILTIIALFAITATSFGQKVKLKKGNFDFLSGVKELKIEYTYNDMKVGKYSEEDYLNKKATEFNKKEEGRGDKWKESWVNDRENRFEPLFEKLFTKYISKAKVKADQNVESEYTMIIHTYFTEPGYYAYVSSRPALINCEAIFVKSGSPDDVLAIVDIYKSPGNSIGATWDTGERIKESYAKAGKELAKFLLKKKAFK